MNIRQIILEEIDDFGWAKDIDEALPQTPYVGLTYVYDNNYKVVYTVTAVRGPLFDLEWFEDGVTNNYRGHRITTYRNQIARGEITPYGVKGINEEDEFEWMKEIEPIVKVTEDIFQEGMRVRLRDTSEYKNQSNGTGTATTIESDYEFIWVNVQWDNGEQNSYRIGIGRDNKKGMSDKDYDLETVAEEPMNESDDLEWMRNIEPADDVTLTNATVGMKVRIKKGTRYYGVHRTYNPADVTGVIDTIYMNHEKLPFYVKWSSYAGNQYGEEDLETSPSWENINEEDEWDWAKDINDQPTLTRDMAVKGTEVMIAKDSEYYDSDYSESNPKDMIGKVHAYKGAVSRRGYLPVEVVWDNGEENEYNLHDLVIV